MKKGTKKLELQKALTVWMEVLQLLAAQKMEMSRMMWRIQSRAWIPALRCSFQGRLIS